MITSLQNEQVKRWRKLHKKKYRNEMNAFLVEGMHLIEEAIKSGFDMKQIIVEESVTIPDSWISQSIITVSRSVFASITQTESPQGVAAVVAMKKLEKRTTGPVLLLDGLQDPGNVGTIIRTADAVGVSEVLVGKGSVDIYNEKTIRATQGSLFHLRMEQVDIIEAIYKLQAEHYTVWAGALQNATPLPDVEFNNKNALVVGNEGAGVSDSVLKLVDRTVKIPIYGEAESLNVSVATGILLYEMVK